jgi:hypothetical protein
MGHDRAEVIGSNTMVKTPEKGDLRDSKRRDDRAAGAAAATTEGVETIPQ